MRSAVIPILFVLVICVAPVFAEDRALVVGVDVYANTRLSPTDGATDDARAMQKLLIDKFGFSRGSIKVLLNSEATASNIARNFQSWLIDGTRPGDRVFFFYAGHGFQAPDDNGDEEDRLDEIITPYDIEISSRNGKIDLPNENTFIRDDKFNDFIAQLSGRRVVLMFDSCHSGTLSRSIGGNSKVLESRYLRLKPTRSMGDGGYSEIPKKGQPRDISTIKEDALDGNINGVVVLSAASPYQQAFPIVAEDNKTRGAFSYIFEKLIRRNSSEKLVDLERDLKREMKGFAAKGILGKSPEGEYQVPQVDIISKTNLAEKPLFGSGSTETDYTAAVESALNNPLSAISVKLELSKRQYRLGDKITYSVNISENAYLYILVFSARNQAFCLFPSVIGGDTVNYMRRGRYTFPRDNYITEATEPVGMDVWVALASQKKLNIGEKEAYTWDEIFSRIGMDALRKAIYERTRGAGNKRISSSIGEDWQADAVVVETVR